VVTGALSVVIADGDCDALDVGERALALVVGIAGEAAGGLAAPQDTVGEGSDRGLGANRRGEPADRLATDIARRAGDHEPDVRSGDARGAQLFDYTARRELVLVGPVKRCHH
jgi:hypothetical protein